MSEIKYKIDQLQKQEKILNDTMNTQRDNGQNRQKMIEREIKELEVLR